MCPACMATVAWTVASGVSTGGVTALVGRAVYKRREKSRLNKRDESEKDNHLPLI